MTHRNERQHHIDRAVIRSVRDCGEGRLIAAPALRASVEIKVDFLAPSLAEIDDSIRHAERAGRLLGVPSETGTKYQLTDAGRGWALASRL
jgi:hypothetical protein